MKYTFNYGKLEGLVLEKYGTYSAFSRAVGMSRQLAYYKLKGERAWTQEDIVKTVDVLNIDKKKVYDYFFAH